MFKSNLLLTATVGTTILHAIIKGKKSRIMILILPLASTATPTTQTIWQKEEARFSATVETEHFLQHC